MLQLKVNSECVDLGIDPVITIDEESPVFEKDSIPGGYSFPFTLPVTERNRRILQFPERIDRKGSMTIEHNFDLYHSGLLRASGKISVTEAGEEYRASLYSGTGDFASRIQGKKLNEVDFGGERTFVNKAEFTRDDDFTLFPIWNPNFLDGLSGYNWEVADWPLNKYDTGTGLFDVSGTFAISPYPFIFYIVKRIFREFGFAIKENILETDPEFRKLVLFSAWDATQLTTVTTSKYVTVGFDPFDGTPIEEWIDITTTTRIMDKFDLADSMPDTLISDFLIWLRNRLNIAYVVDKYNNVKIIRRDQLITGHEATDITAKAIGDPQVIAVDLPDGFKLSWEHDAEDTNFAEENFKNIEDNLDKVKGTVADTTEMAALTPELNDIYYVESLDSYMQYAYQDDIGDGTSGYNWIHYTIGYQNYLSGNMEEEFFSGISTLRWLFFQRAPGAAKIKCPYTRQKSNGYERPQPVPFSPRMLIYQGLQLDEVGNYVPMGSNDNLDFNLNQISGANLTLKWEGTYGIYNQLWKNYLTWWMSRKQVNWKVKDPSSLDFATKYRIDRNEYLLKKRTVIYTAFDILPAECEFYLI